MKSRGQKDFMDMLLKEPARCDVKVSTWHPKKPQLDWMLELKGFKVKIHVDVPTIINLYDGKASYTSPTAVTIYVNDKDVESLRRHPRLKHAYEEWDEIQITKREEVNS